MLRLLSMLTLSSLLAVAGLVWLQRHAVVMRGQETTRSASPEAATGQVDATASVMTDGTTRAVFTSPEASEQGSSAAAATAPPGAPASAAGDPRAALQLSFERGVVVPGGLSQRASDHLLRAGDFRARIAEVAGESARDPEAADMTRVYREAVERSLRESGTRARLDRFACGTQLCIGGLIDGSEDDYQTWVEVFAKRGRAPTYAMNTHIQTDASGGPVLRFAFTIDPTFNGIVVDGE